MQCLFSNIFENARSIKTLRRTNWINIHVLILGLLWPITSLQMRCALKPTTVQISGCDVDWTKSARQRCWNTSRTALRKTRYLTILKPDWNHWQCVVIICVIQISWDHPCWIILAKTQTSRTNATKCRSPHGCNDRGAGSEKKSSWKPVWFLLNCGSLELPWNPVPNCPPQSYWGYGRW